MGLTAKAKPLGLSTLDGNGKVPTSQIPTFLTHIESQGVAVANVAAMTSATITGGESPTEAEHNALRVDVVNTRTTLTALIASLRTSGVIDT